VHAINLWDSVWTKCCLIFSWLGCSYWSLRRLFSSMSSN
jgi:hypothetical protein